MNNNSMIEYKESFISKIKNFFKNIFKRKQAESTFSKQITETSSIEVTESKNEKEFFTDIKVDTTNIDKFMDKKNFIEYIDGNVEALKMLSVDRLRKLKEYYDGVIEENDKIIKNLKKSL